ncbi:MAG TPA: DUF749 domain-containing protein [Euryarchaeota archaeon]|nr:hypothetical protein BMS3Abin16_00592 [archaeon BMS3Abin16]GBE56211.1 hypothetical protein BMS3Bbin16_00410 [archaeon BMS3Bbin16]HDH28842.1 DUF749 domain-containing protein [Euryarchaeota archaeon]HDY73848.1 DUF749 domain-containing protein [Euryarchaeota archaeon]
MADTVFVASIADTKYVREMPEEYLPYVNFRAGLEGRVLQGDERVAILNVSTTTSYIAVFLDPGKTISDLELEVEESGAALNADSKIVLQKILRS